jgi:hypothetical protein
MKKDSARLVVLGLLGVVALLVSCSTFPVAPKAQPRVDAAGTIVITVASPFKGEMLEDSLRDFDALVGRRGEEITPKDVRVEIAGDEIGFPIEDETVVADWITNLPAGLTQRIHEAKAGDTVIYITVAGTPQTTLREPVQVTIPGSVLKGAAALHIKENPQALIDIAEATLDLAAVALTAENSWARTTATKSIRGTVGTGIPKTELTIRLDAAALRAKLKKDTDLSSWITNLPTGLTAKTAQQFPKGATAVTVIVAGVPMVGRDEAIRVQVSGERNYLNRREDLEAVVSEDIRFEIIGAKILTDRELVIGGSVSQPLNQDPITISLSGGAFAAALPAGTDVSAWITNLPVGLSARVEYEVPLGATSAEVRVSGTPIRPLRGEYAAIALPGNLVGRAVPLPVINFVARAVEPPKDKKAPTAAIPEGYEMRQVVRFDIGTFARAEVFGATTTAHSNAAWKGEADWLIKTPQLPSVKDFEGVGIVMVRGNTTQTLGDDGEYYWRGDMVTYSDLMAEAQRLNAHGIINVMIDYTDEVNFVTTRREMVDSRLSAAEEAKRAKKHATIEDIGGTRYYVETIQVTTRHYTGTALAIRYTTASTLTVPQNTAITLTPGVR